MLPSRVVRRPVRINRPTFVAPSGQDLVLPCLPVVGLPSSQFPARNSNLGVDWRHMGHFHSSWPRRVADYSDKLCAWALLGLAEGVEKSNSASLPTSSKISGRPTTNCGGLYNHSCESHPRPYTIHHQRVGCVSTLRTTSPLS